MFECSFYLSLNLNGDEEKDNKVLPVLINVLNLTRTFVETCPPGLHIKKLLTSSIYIFIYLVMYIHTYLNFQIVIELSKCVKILIRKFYIHTNVCIKTNTYNNQNF